MRRSCHLLGAARLILGAALVSPVAAAHAQVGVTPVGWHASGDGATTYTIGSDVSRRPGGTGFTSGYIKATTTSPSGSATLSQQINAERFRGQRVRLTGYVRRTGDAGTAILFLRIDGLGQDGLADYAAAQVFVPSRDSDDGRGWIQRSIVVDIPAHSTAIRIGIVSIGVDEVWLDDVSFQQVGDAVSLTGSVIAAPTEVRSIRDMVTTLDKRKQASLQKRTSEFVNLDFEAFRPRN